MKSPILWLAAASLPVAQSQEQTGNHPDWPRWCGKVYQKGYPNFDPGGQIPIPTPVLGPPLVDVKFAPRYNLYLSSEPTGEFIVNTPFSSYHGKPWPNTTTSPPSIIFSINLASTNQPLVQNLVPVNATSTLFPFPLSLLTPSLKPIPLVLYGAPEGGEPTWTASSSLLYLPEKPTGSVTRIDNLNGGLLFRNSATKGKFEPFFPYGFYSSYDGFLRNKNNSEIQAYQDLGLNAITPLTVYSDSAEEFAFMEGIGLRWLYTLRERFKNLTEVRGNVVRAREAEGVWGYWSVDEPDGWQDPFEAPKRAYDLIRELDPYHPVAVVLNCENYYYKEYSAQADIIMADVYPIGINSTFSKWDTPCNTTYGDCGCDNCAGTPLDVSHRLSRLSLYETYLGRFPPKPLIFSPQSFHGEGYWLRSPTRAESHAMVALGMNHGAVGIISWVFPTSSMLAKAHGDLAKVVTNSPVVDFVSGGARPERLEVRVQGMGEMEVLDAAGWRVGRRVLVCVVNGGAADVERGVEVVVVVVGGEVTGVEKAVWGDVKWEVKGNGLVAGGLKGLEVSMVILELRG